MSQRRGAGESGGTGSGKRHRGNRNAVITYGGNLFTLRYREHRKGDYWIVVKFRVMKHTLAFPSRYDGVDITKVFYQPRVFHRHYDVTAISFPACYTDIWLPAKIFPSLEKVTVGEGSCFTTDGEMLYTRGGKVLYLSMAGRYRDVEVPAEVEFIKDQAFQHTSCSGITVRNPRVRFSPGKDPFRGSEWNKKKERLIICEDTLVFLGSSEHHFRLPEGVRLVGEDAFCTVMPEVLIVESKRVKLSRRMYEEGRLPRTVLSPTKLMEYRNVGGILFTKDRKVLFDYPQSAPIGQYRIPFGTTHVADYAFFRCRVSTLTMADTVRSLGKGAFAGSSSLSEVVLSEGITSLPDAVLPEDGVFSRCNLLKKVRFPSKLRYIGAYAFYRDSASISLPRSVQAVGRGAFAGCGDLTVYEGTAKGLMRGFFDEGIGSGEVNLTILPRGEEGEKVSLVIPMITEEEALCHLEKAWDGDSVDYGELVRGMQWDNLVTLYSKRINLLALLRYLPKEEWALLQEPLSKDAWMLGRSLMEAGEEAHFAQFLSAFCPDDELLEKFLDLCNEDGAELTRFIPFLLNRKNAMGYSRSSFSL